MLIDRLNDLVKRLRDGKVPDGEIGTGLQKLIHSPAVMLAVRATPTPVDDAFLALLRAIVPPPA